MKLRRRYDELATEVSHLAQQRELLLTQISDDKAEWDKQQRVGLELLTCLLPDAVAAPWGPLYACWCSFHRKLHAI